MPSSSASTDSAGVRCGPPLAAIASQNAPAPRPSSTRPPLSRSRLAAERASTAGGRSGRLATLGETRIRSVRPTITDSSVQVSRNAGLVRVVLHRHQVEAGLVGQLGERDHPVGRVGASV